MSLYALVLGTLAATTAEDPPPSQFVLLHNGRVLEGQLIQSLDRWTLRMRVGASLRLDINEIDLIGDSKLHLYHQLQQRTRRDELGDRMKIVDFCIRQGLLDEAADEITWLSQDGLDVDRLARLTAKVQAARKQEQVAARQKVGEQPADLASSSGRPHRSGEDDLTRVEQERSTQQSASRPAEPELDEQEFSLFVRFAQPHLLLGCAQARCHGSLADNGFKFERLELGASPTRKMSQANYLMLKDWLQSESPTRLLELATLPHGGMRDAVWREDELGAEVLKAWLLRVDLSIPSVASGERRTTSDDRRSTTSGVRPASFDQSVEGDGVSADAGAVDPYAPQPFHDYIKLRQLRAAAPPLPHQEAQPAAPPSESAGQPASINSPPRSRSKND